MREPDVGAQARDEAVSSAEHELNNSLAAILGFSEVIRRDPSLPAELRHNADLLVEEAQKTRQMVQELLDLARGRTIAGSTTGAADPGDEAAASPKPTNLRRVLVLEDEPSIRVYLDKALQLLGYEPVITSLGPEAIELARAGDYAALLFDHRLAGMTGPEAYAAVVAIRPDLAERFVMMSGDVLDPALEALAAEHPVTLLGKPFDLDTLDRTIRAVMGATGQDLG